MTEQQLLVDCLRRLNSNDISYYLTGSMASNYWGIPRTTHDLDFVIQLPPSAASKMIAAFSPDYFVDEAAVLAAYQPPYQFNAIDTRSALKVDFWFPRATPFDQEMLRRKMAVTILNESAWIVTAEDCVLHKLLWNRITPSDRQLGDAAGVVAVQQNNLDREYLRKWAQTLEISRELEELISGRIKPKTT